MIDNMTRCRRPPRRDAISELFLPARRENTAWAVRIRAVRVPSRASAAVPSPGARPPTSVNLQSASRTSAELRVSFPHQLPAHSCRAGAAAEDRLQKSTVFILLLKGFWGF